MLSVLKIESQKVSMWVKQVMEMKKRHALYLDSRIIDLKISNPLYILFGHFGHFCPFLRRQNQSECAKMDSIGYICIKMVFKINEAKNRQNETFLLKKQCSQRLFSIRKM